MIINPQKSPTEIISIVREKYQNLSKSISNNKSIKLLSDGGNDYETKKFTIKTIENNFENYIENVKNIFYLMTPLEIDNQHYYLMISIGKYPFCHIEIKNNKYVIAVESVNYILLALIFFVLCSLFSYFFYNKIIMNYLSDEGKIKDLQKNKFALMELCENRINLINRYAEIYIKSFPSLIDFCNDNELQELEINSRGFYDPIHNKKIDLYKIWKNIYSLFSYSFDENLNNFKFNNSEVGSFFGDTDTFSSLFILLISKLNKIKLQKNSTVNIGVFIQKNEAIIECQYQSNAIINLGDLPEEIKVVNLKKDKFNQITIAFVSLYKNKNAINMSKTPKGYSNVISLFNN